MKVTNTEKFIEAAKKVQKNEWNYSESIYINNKTKITIICNKHGPFEQLPSNHLKGRGCYQCGRDISAKKQTKSCEQFINEANIIFNFKYDYSEFKYINNCTPGVIICPIHQKTYQTPINHLKGNGCYLCGHIIQKQSITSTKEEFVNNANIIHNFKYSYKEFEYINSYTKSIIICPIHKNFYQTPGHHIFGSGCPKCGKGKNISKLETEWLDSLSIPIEYRNTTIKINSKKKIKVDAYCPKTNTIYEFNGDFWHGNPKKFNQNDNNPIAKKTFGELYQETIKKEKLIKDLGYNLVVMWESEFKKNKIE